MLTTFPRGHNTHLETSGFESPNMHLSMSFFSCLTPTRLPSASLSLLMMSLPFLSHQRNSFMSVGPHLECVTQKAVRAQTQLSHQQNPYSCQRHKSLRAVVFENDRHSDRHRGFILRDWASELFKPGGRHCSCYWLNAWGINVKPWQWWRVGKKNFHSQSRTVMS